MEAVSFWDTDKAESSIKAPMGELAKQLAPDLNVYYCSYILAFTDFCEVPFFVHVKYQNW